MTTNSKPNSSIVSFYTFIKLLWIFLFVFCAMPVKCSCDFTKWKPVFRANITNKARLAPSAWLLQREPPIDLVKYERNRSVLASSLREMVISEFSPSWEISVLFRWPGLTLSNKSARNYSSYIILPISVQLSLWVKTALWRDLKFIPLLKF